MAKRHRVPTAPRPPRLIVETVLAEHESWLIGPNEVLLVRVGEGAGTPDQRAAIAQSLAQHLNRLGLGERCLVITADDLTVAVVSRDAPSAP